MDEEIIYLKKGGVYFYAAFLDGDLTIPIIETYIFIGFDEEDGYLFHEAEDETTQICFETDDIDIYDKKALSKWLLEDHSPNYPPRYENYIYKTI